MVGRCAGVQGGLDQWRGSAQRYGEGWCPGGEASGGAGRTMQGLAWGCGEVRGTAGRAAQGLAWREGEAARWGTPDCGAASYGLEHLTVRKIWLKNNCVPYTYFPIYLISPVIFNTGGNQISDNVSPGYIVNPLGHHQWMRDDNILSYCPCWQNTITGVRFPCPFFL